LSLLGSSALPPEDEKTYFDGIIDKCSELLQSNVVQSVIQITYNGIFVDEYQDCTIDQHKMIMLLGVNLPLHLLGDPLQGIFSFELKPLVNFDNDLASFQRFNLLKYPWRWHKDNIALGKQILEFRTILESKQPIVLKSNFSANLIVEQCKPNLGEHSPEYSRWLRCIFEKYDNESLLVIYPSYKHNNTYGQLVLKGILSDRIKLKSKIDFNNSYRILDAIDSSEYYRCAKKIDKYLENCRNGRRIKRIARLYDIMDGLHINTTSLNKWINKKENRFTSRTKKYAPDSEHLKYLFDKYEKSININNLILLINFIFNLSDMKCHYKGLYYELKHSAEISISESITMFDAMKVLKSKIRHIGRKVDGRCIGTTLLTKGLEFDTVIIYGADKFEDSKNSYVAISRACRRLVLLTETTTINFPKE
ncbi:MAG: UvrD-helicase domain-containing protein, partial [Bacteroidaceae bacterium]